MKHGHCKGYKKPAEYIAWINMRQRCARTDGPDFPNYKGRGIEVCPEWSFFETFLRDMGPRPSPRHTVERSNNDLGYCKSNCVWATREVQSRNQRTRKDNRFGLRGVSISHGHFHVQGSLNGKRTHLYYGPDFFEACCFRKSWEAKTLGATS